MVTLSRGLMFSLPLRRCSQNPNAEQKGLGRVRHPLEAKARLVSARTILIRRLAVVLCAHKQLE